MERDLAAVPVGEMLNPGNRGKMEAEFRRRLRSHMVSSHVEIPSLRKWRPPNAKSENDTAKEPSYIMRKFKKAPPSVVLHLHPTHFRFDQQDGSFSYNSPMRFLLEHIKNATVPHDIVEELLINGVKFYEGIFIC